MTARLPVAAGVLLVCGAAGTALLADTNRRSDLARSGRLMWLGTRRVGAYGVTIARGMGRGEKRRAELADAFVVRTAQEATRELGQMKGVVMKAGQLLSVIGEALPDEAQAALAQLQSDAPPLQPGLADAILRREWSARARSAIVEWDPEPVAAASIGQVHKGLLRDGREVAIKIQYPGMAATMRSDLANAERIYQLLSAFALKGLDVKAMTEELRARMFEELDYRREAENQRLFAGWFAGHPFIRVPRVVDELCTENVLVTEWADGWSWDRFEREADAGAKASAAEVVFRFGQACIYQYLSFNGDPHPGNYLFHPDGTVTFLDFGLVKHWTTTELDQLWPLIDPLLDGDAEKTVAEMVRAGFLAPDHGLDPDLVWSYVSTPYRPYLTDEFTFTRDGVADALRTVIDVRGPHKQVVERLNMPPSFVILDRVVWGMSALLGRLNATNRWRSMLAEYRDSGPPVTPMGEAEALWRADRKPS